jgi:hypothetical protein
MQERLQEEEVSTLNDLDLLAGELRRLEAVCTRVQYELRQLAAEARAGDEQLDRSRFGEADNRLPGAPEWLAPRTGLLKSRVPAKPLGSRIVNWLAAEPLRRVALLLHGKGPAAKNSGTAT